MSYVSPWYAVQTELTSCINRCEEMEIKMCIYMYHLTHYHANAATKAEAIFAIIVGPKLVPTTYPWLFTKPNKSFNILKHSFDGVI